MPRPRLPMRVTSETLAIGLVFLVIAVLAAMAPAQSDTWWLLRAGQDIWRTGSIPLVDPYSSTAAGMFWPNHEWLTELVFFGTHRIGGMPLVTALCACVIIATWVLCWRMTAGSFELRFLIFAGSVATSATGWALRPQVLSLALFMVTCAVVVRARHRWWLPLVFVVWANLHGAVALGLVAIAGAIAADVIRTRRMPVDLAALLVVCGLATLISPLGTGLWTFIPESMARSRANALIEWLPPDAAAGFWFFWALAAALPIAIALALRFRRLDDRGARLAGIAMLMLPLAAQARRNVPVFLLIAVPAVTTLLARPRPAVRRAPRGENARVNAALLGVAGLIAAFIVSGAWLARAPHLGWDPIPAASIGAIRACEAPIYNTYGDGGVLIWFVPEQRVFIDNRQDPYPLDLLRLNHDLEVSGQYEDAFARYEIRCAVVPAASIAAERLAADPAWTRTHDHLRWTVFERSR